MKKHFALKYALIILLSSSGICAQHQPLTINVDGNTMHNEAAVYFDTAGSYYYNPVLDAPSLGVNPGYLDIVTVFDSIDFQIKCLPALSQTVNIPLRILTGATGTYNISLSNINCIPAGAWAILEDKQTGSSYNMRSGSYSCHISDTETVARFVLMIYSSALSGVSTSLSNPTCKASQNGQIIASANNTGTFDYYWMDSNNVIIRTALHKSGADTLSLLNAGVYRVDINQSGTYMNESVYVSLSGIKSPMATFVSDTIVAKYSTVTFTNTSLNSTTSLWEFGDGMGSASTNCSHIYNAEGTYTVTLQVNSTQCNESSEISKVITVSASLSALPMISSKDVWVGKDLNGVFVEYSYEETASEVSIISIDGKLLEKAETGAAPGRIYILRGYDASGPVIVRIFSREGKVFSSKVVLSQ